ncbi:MAG: hypothetical protein AAFR66_02815 [Bacteroidota bacterium]
MEKRNISALAFSCMLLLFGLNTYAQTPSLSNAELLSFQGMHTGELTYKNYSGGDLVTLPFVGVTYQKKGKLIIEHSIYEGGRVIKQNYNYEVKNGQLIGGGGTWDVKEKESGTDGRLSKLVVSRSGKDGNDNRKCTFRTTFDFSSSHLTITKDVKFDDEEEYFMRNKYVMNSYPSGE